MAFIHRLIILRIGILNRILKCDYLTDIIFVLCSNEYFFLIFFKKVFIPMCFSFLLLPDPGLTNLITEERINIPG